MEYVLVFGAFFAAAVGMHLRERSAKKRGKGRACSGNCSVCPIQCRAKFL